MPHKYRAFGLPPIGTWVKRTDTPVYARPVYDSESRQMVPGTTPQPFA